MNILILVPIWGRPKITKIWIEGLKWFLTPNITVLCVLSPEDQFLVENEGLIIKNGFERCYFKNKPLGLKLNAGVQYALDNYKFDYLMNLGSDDLIHPAIFSLYDSYIKEGYKFFGLDKVYFFNILTKELGLTKPYLWGAGRMISREILERIEFKGSFLYKSDFGRGLDCNSIENIKFLLGIDYKQVETNDFPYLVDIKSENGINDFYLMAKMYDLVDSSILKQFYPEFIIKMLW